MSRKQRAVVGLMLVLATIVGGASTHVDAAPKSNGKMSTPSLALFSTTATTMTITVTAGPTGAPAGFSLQWMTADEYAANGDQWYASDDPRLCKASFSGNANGSNYNLGPNASVNVQVGDVLFDNPGASSNCPSTPLTCDTTYVFRVFAHANSSLQRSDFSQNYSFKTLPCSAEEGGCTYTQGYWKTHGAAGPASPKVYDEGGNVIGYTSLWPVSSLTLGNTSYTEAQLQSILDNPASGNGLVSLAHQLIAAKLNVANGAPDGDIAQAIADADTLIGNKVVPPVGNGSLKPAATSSLTGTLATWNEGGTGPGHCL